MPNILVPILHVEDPHPTGRYPDQKSLILCSLFLLELSLVGLATQTQRREPDRKPGPDGGNEIAMNNRNAGF